MRHRGWMLWMMPLLLLAPLAGSPASPDQALWKLGSFTWVKLVPAEPGASPNAQPVAISPEVLQATLGPVLAKDDGEDIPLFGRKELLELSKALSEALSLAQPGEDVALLSTSRHGHGFLERATGLTARLFVRDGALNLIVQDARLNFLDSYQMDNLEPTFTYGSRQAASKASLQAPRACHAPGSAPHTRTPGRPCSGHPSSRDDGFTFGRTQGSPRRGCRLRGQGPAPSDPQAPPRREPHQRGGVPGEARGPPEGVVAAYRLQFQPSSSSRASPIPKWWATS